ncbi:MAG: hypothetical protein R6U94_09155 [Nitriliruptoraceae bacterium]
MNAHTRSWTLAVVALVALTLLAGPAVAQIEDQSVLAVEDTLDETTETGESESGRRPLADSPRDRLGLLLLAALVVGGGAAVANGRRQLKGERPQASGEFRWR